MMLIVLPKDEMLPPASDRNNIAEAHVTLQSEREDAPDDNDGDDCCLRASTAVF